MISKFKIILILILTPIILEAQSSNSNLPSDSISIKFHNIIESQNKTIFKLDSTITHLKNENTHLKELAEQDIDHAKSLINVIEIILGFIAALLTIFTVVGAYYIRKMSRQSTQIKEDHRILKEDWEKTRKEIGELKESSIKEGKELLQILFYITEGDNYLEFNIDEAIRLYEQALAVRQDNPEIYAKIAQANLTLGRYEQAISQLEKGSKIASDNISILYALARANRKQKHYDKAESLCKKILEINKADLLALKELSRIYLINHDYKNAKEISEELLVKDSSYIPHSNLAIISAFEKDNSCAEYHFKQALEKVEKLLLQSPDNKWLNISKVIQLIGLSRWTEAEPLLRNLKKQNLNHSEIEFIFERLHILLDITNDKKIREMISFFESKIIK